MCKGYYKDGRPIIEAYIIPLSSSLKLYPVPVEFLIDTGSDVTAINRYDALRMGIDIEKLQQSEEVTGISGKPIKPFYISNVLIATIEIEKFWLHMHAELMNKIEVIPEMPISILGRDFLDRFRLNISKASDIVELQREVFGEGSHYGITISFEDMAKTVSKIFK